MIEVLGLALIVAALGGAYALGTRVPPQPPRPIIKQVITLDDVKPAWSSIIKHRTEWGTDLDYTVKADVKVTYNEGVPTTNKHINIQGYSHWIHIDMREADDMIRAIKAAQLQLEQVER